MIKKLFHIVLSAAMALLLVFGSVSKEYLHLFADHTDTVHCGHHDSEGIYFDNQHHHCDFLSFTLLPFVNDVAVYHFEYHTAPETVIVAEAVVHLTPRAVPVSRLRGPPAAFVYRA